MRTPRQRRFPSPHLSPNLVTGSRRRLAANGQVIDLAPDGSNPATAKNKAGLSFIPIQKNPKFSIKRTVTVF
jgi:hypothetical protein